jgi:S-adenosylmethionine:tRNA ribosyltransferase-isomerase
LNAALSARARDGRADLACYACRVHVSELVYALPEELVAQRPLAERDAARLLVLDREHGAVTHREVRELADLVRPALWVVNDTRVIPARLFAYRVREREHRGGRVELLLVQRRSAPGAREVWHALGRANKKLAPGAVLGVEGVSMGITVRERHEYGTIEIELEADEPITDVLERIGHVPLPPYVRRPDEDEDRERYQTMFASRPGAVAAPTAGLHFSPRLVEELVRRGHRIARVTLHVGPGSFRPVKKERLEDHPMHAERYEIDGDAAAAIDAARVEGMAVVAVGTTVVRTLESAAIGEGRVRAGEGETALFITPPHRFQVVDALMTNFHLPRSTLLALVMAFGGIDAVRRAYAAAVEARYRFFSYGDAMLVI